MRLVPQPIAIITSTDISTGTPIYRGATISSFTTVTIEPIPIVSLNIKRPSATFDAIESSGLFHVHLLNASPTSTKLATAFTKGSSESPFQMETSLFKIHSKLNGVESRTPPEISSPAIAFCIPCRYYREKTVELGDHVVLFGSVHSAFRLISPEALAGKPCLVYANGSYNQVDNVESTSLSQNSIVVPENARISPPQVPITNADFDLFLSKISFMDHSSLDPKILSDIVGSALPRSSYHAIFPAFQEHSEDLQRLIRKLRYKYRRRQLSRNAKPGSQPALCTGLWEAIAYHRIFLSSVPVFGVQDRVNLPTKTIELLEAYRHHLLETNLVLTELQRSLYNLHQTHPNYEVSKSALISIRKAPVTSLQDLLPYLEGYVRTCLGPIKSTALVSRTWVGGSMLAARTSLKQYNKNARDLLFFVTSQLYLFHDNLPPAIRKVYQLDERPVENLPAPSESLSESLRPQPGRARPVHKLNLSPFSSAARNQLYPTPYDSSRSLRKHRASDGINDAITPRTIAVARLTPEEKEKRMIRAELDKLGELMGSGREPYGPSGGRKRPNVKENGSCHSVERQGHVPTKMTTDDFEDDFHPSSRAGPAQEAATSFDDQIWSLMDGEEEYSTPAGEKTNSKNRLLPSLLQPKATKEPIDEEDLDALFKQLRKDMEI